jgi:hypothetical protein
MRTEDRSLASKKSAAKNAEGRYRRVPDASIAADCQGTLITADASRRGEARPKRVTQWTMLSTWRKVESAVVVSAEDMVLGLIEKAKEGNPQAAKFLFELVEIKREGSTKAADSCESLASVLLSRLDSEAGAGSAAEDRPHPESDI